MKQNEEFDQAIKDWWEDQSKNEDDTEIRSLLQISGTATDADLEEVVEGMI